MGPTKSMATISKRLHVKDSKGAFDEGDVLKRAQLSQMWHQYVTFSFIKCHHKWFVPYDQLMGDRDAISTPFVVLDGG